MSSLAKESLYEFEPKKSPENKIDLTIINCINAEYFEEKDRFMKASVIDSEILNNIKIMAISSFELSTDSENVHLRFIENDNEHETFKHSIKDDNEIYALPGVCLYDDSKLSEILELYLSKTSKKELTFLLSPHRAPSKNLNEISIKCSIEDISSSLASTKEFVEIIISLNTTRVSDLTDILVKKYNLPIIEETSTDQYFLKTLNWLGDADTILNDSNSLCLDAPLKHNDFLVLCKGKLIPRDHCKINIWQHGSEEISNKFSQLATSENLNEVFFNDFMAKMYQDFVLKGEIVIKNDTKLEELMLEIKDLLGSTYLENDINLRLRLMKENGKNEKEFLLKKCLLDFNKPIKQLNFKQENDICVQKISGEDSLNQGIILINCIQFNNKTKKCPLNSFKEISWNVNNGATLTSLKESILKAYDSDLEPSDIFRMTISKRIHDKNKWILLKEINNSNSEEPKSKNGKTNSLSKKSKKKSNLNQSNQKSNLRLSPFNMDDGDFIAFIINSTDLNNKITAEDFMSTIDIEYAKKSQAEIERLQKERSKKKNDPNDATLSYNYSRKPEIGITIKIDDFN